MQGGVGLSAGDRERVREGGGVGVGGHRDVAVFLINLATIVPPIIRRLLFRRCIHMKQLRFI